MNSLNFLKKIAQPIFYVTNDIAKGIGLENLLPDYHIVCLDDHPLVDYLLKAGVRVFCLERELKQKNQIFRSTSRIIDHPMVLDYIRKEGQNQKPNILYFKPSAKIDLVCLKYGFNKIGNPIRLNRIFEDKISFYEKARENNWPVPVGEVGELGKLNFKQLQDKYGLPLVIQFGRGWAGGTTFFINKENEFSALLIKNFLKKVKITKYIKGRTILNNACIFGRKILISPPAVQINSIPEFSANPGATIGRQWPAGLEKKQIAQITALTKNVGQMMMQSGYQGYFGLDFLVDKKGEIFLSENNARLTASTPFYTKMEIEINRIPLLAYHLLSFLKIREEKVEASDFNLSASEVVARNNYEKPIFIKGLLEPGKYQFNQQELCFLRPEYYGKNLSENEFWLTAAGQKRIVNPEIEIIRINFFHEVLDSEGKLDPLIIRILLAAKEKLICQNVKA